MKVNPISRFFWKILANKKLNSNNIPIRYNAIHILGEFGNEKTMDKLYLFLSDDEQIIRNVASLSLKSITRKMIKKEVPTLEVQSKLIDLFRDVKSLASKISIIEVLRELPLKIREDLLGPIVKNSEDDLLHAILVSLEETQNLEILEDMLMVSESNDTVIRRVALESWVKGLENMEFDDILEYITPRLHQLIRINYELQLDGSFLRKVLSYANQSQLPDPKAYPDFIIRYLTELLGNWDYDPEAYRSLHAIVVPSYFTFSDDDLSESEKPFMIL
jgi:hypothetical protein